MKNHRGLGPFLIRTMLALTALSLGFVASPLRSQEIRPGEPDVEVEIEYVSAVIPVIGHVAGFEGVEWRSDVAVRNDLSYAVDIFLSVPGVPGEPFVMQTLAPGESVTFTDASATTFGTMGYLSPLVVQTPGVQSVSVLATAYGIKDGKVTRTQIIPAVYGTTGPGTRTLRGLSFGNEYRTNIGLGNLGDTTVTLSLALQRVAGRNLAVTTVVVPPHSLIHESLQKFFPLVTEGSNFSVVVDSAYPGSYAYASVILNSTNDGTFVRGF